MADEVGELIVRLTGDGTGYQKTLRDAETSTKRSASTIDQALANIKKAEEALAHAQKNRATVSWETERQLQRALTDTKIEYDRLVIAGEAAAEMATKMSRGTGLMVVGVGAATAAVGALALGVIETYNEMERLQRQIELTANEAKRLAGQEIGRILTDLDENLARRKGANDPVVRFNLMKESLRDLQKETDSYSNKVGQLQKELTDPEIDQIDPLFKERAQLELDKYTKLRDASEERVASLKREMAQEGRSDAARIFESTRDAVEKYRLELERLQVARNRPRGQNISEEDYQRGLAKAQEELNHTLGISTTAGEKYSKSLGDLQRAFADGAISVSDFERGVSKADADLAKASGVDDYDRRIGKFLKDAEKTINEHFEETGKMKKRGQQLLESLIPEEAYNAKVRELNELLKNKVITPELHNLGVQKAQEQLDKFYQQTQKDYTVHFGFKSRGAVESGTQEAQAQIEQYTGAIKKMYKDAENAPKLKVNPIIPQVFQAPQLNAGGAGGAAAAQQAGGAQQVTGLLQQLVTIAQQQLDKAGITLSPTSFNE